MTAVKVGGIVGKSKRFSYYKKAFWETAYHLQFHRLARWLRKHRTIILMYHGLWDRASDRLQGIENYHGKHVEVTRLRTQMDHLRRAYHIISLSELVQHYREDTPPPPRSVVVTVDDGYRSVYTLGYPVWREYQIPVTVFLTTNFLDGKGYLWTDRLEYAVNTADSQIVRLPVGLRQQICNLNTQAARQKCERRMRHRLKRLSQTERQAAIDAIETQLGHRLAAAECVPSIYRPLSWEQVREMAASGVVEFGSHTCSHAIVTQIEREVLKQELMHSKQRIETEIGKPCTLFCYPNGAVGDFDDDVKHLLEELGYMAAPVAISGDNRPGSDLFELKRYSVNDNQSMAEFAMIVSGAKAMVKRLHIGS